MMTASNPTKLPQLLWAQDRKQLFLTVQCLDSKNVKLTHDTSRLEFSADNASGDHYAFELPLFESVKESTWHSVVTNRTITLTVEKENQNTRFWPRLQKQEGKLAWVKTDFSKFQDDTFDDPEEEPALDMGGGPGAGGFDQAFMQQLMANQGNVDTFEAPDSDDEADDVPPLEEDENKA